MNYDRITNLYQNKTKNIPFKKVIDRNKWIQHLQNNLTKKAMTTKHKTSLLAWATTTKITKDHLEKTIDATSWRSSQAINY